MCGKFLRAILVGSALVAPTNLASASNDQFFAILATLAGRSSLYQCPIEVATEQVDPECIRKCTIRVFFHVDEASRPGSFLAGKFVKEDMRVKAVMPERESFVVIEPK